MLKFPEFHFKKPVILFVGILGMIFFTVEAFAQSENEKVEEIYPKTNDRIILEDHTLIHDNSAAKITVAKPTTASKIIAPATVKKDSTVGENISDKEVRKNESPSTLSFNIFLYIVDKFKAD